MKRLTQSLRLAVTAVCAGIAACGTAGIDTAGVAARVNGVDIATAQLEEEFAFTIQGLEPAPDVEEADDLKLQLLNDMITNEIMMQLAAERGLMATDAEVDAQFNEYRAQYSTARFQELLDSQGLTRDEVRDDLRVSLMIEKLVNMEITSRITVSDEDVRTFFERNAASFDFPESYLIAHILITPVRDEAVNNLEGDDATTLDEARDKAARLLREIQDGQDFGMIARRYSEDPSSAPAGGELGFRPIESIAGLDPALAEAVLRLDVGETLPAPVETGFGLHLVKLLDVDAGGRKDPSDPRIENDIRQMLFARRDQLLRGAFYEKARNDAEVENYFAERILERAY